MNAHTSTFRSAGAAAAGPRTAARAPTGEARGLLSAAIPFAAAGLLHMAITLTDSAMIALVGADALATSALVSDSRALVFYFVGGGFAALAPLMAAARDDPAALRRMYASGFGLAVMMTLAGVPLVMSLGWTLPMAGIAMPDPEGAVAYSVAIAFACAAMIFAQFLRSVLAPLGRGRVVVVAMAAAVPINALANWVLMFGPGGLPALGLAGAGYGTAVAYAAVTVWLAIVCSRELDLPLLRSVTLRPRGLGPLAAATVMTGFGLLCETGLYMVGTLVGGLADPAATAEHVVALRFLGTCYCVFVGLGQAASIAAARPSGRADPGAAARTALVATLIVGGVAAIAAEVIVPELIVAAFPAPEVDPTLLATYVAATLIVLAFAVTGLSSLRGAGRVRATAVISAAGYWGVGASTLAVLAATGPVGLTDVWTSLFTGTAATAAASWALLVWGATPRRATA